MDAIANVTIKNEAPVHSGERRFALIRHICRMRIEVSRRNMLCEARVRSRMRSFFLHAYGIDVGVDAKDSDAWLVSLDRNKDAILANGPWVPYAVYGSDLWFMLHVCAFGLPCDDNHRDPSWAPDDFSDNHTANVELEAQRVAFAWLASHILMLIPESHRLFVTRHYYRPLTKGQDPLDAIAKAALHGRRAECIARLYLMHRTLRNIYSGVSSMTESRLWSSLQNTAPTALHARKRNMVSDMFRRRIRSRWGWIDSVDKGLAKQMKTNASESGLESGRLGSNEPCEDVDPTIRAYSNYFCKTPGDHPYSLRTHIERYRVHIFKRSMNDALRFRPILDAADSEGGGKGQVAGRSVSRNNSGVRFILLESLRMAGAWVINSINDFSMARAGATDRDTLRSRTVVPVGWTAGSWAFAIDTKTWGSGLLTSIFASLRNRRGSATGSGGEISVRDILQWGTNLCHRANALFSCIIDNDAFLLGNHANFSHPSPPSIAIKIDKKGCGNDELWNWLSNTIGLVGDDELTASADDIDAVFRAWSLSPQQIYLRLLTGATNSLFGPDERGETGIDGPVESYTNEESLRDSSYTSSHSGGDTIEPPKNQAHRNQWSQSCSAIEVNTESGCARKDMPEFISRISHKRHSKTQCDNAPFVEGGSLYSADRFCSKHFPVLLYMRLFEACTRGHSECLQRIYRVRAAVREYQRQCASGPGISSIQGGIHQPTFARVLKCTRRATLFGPGTGTEDNAAASRTVLKNMALASSLRCIAASALIAYIGTLQRSPRRMISIRTSFEIAWLRREISKASSGKGSRGEASSHLTSITSMRAQAAWTEALATISRILPSTLMQNLTKDSQDGQRQSNSAEPFVVYIDRRSNNDNIRTNEGKRSNRSNTARAVTRIVLLDPVFDSYIDDISISEGQPRLRADATACVWLSPRYGNHKLIRCEDCVCSIVRLSELEVQFLQKHHLNAAGLGKEKDWDKKESRFTHTRCPLDRMIDAALLKFSYAFQDVNESSADGSPVKEIKKQTPPDSLVSNTNPLPQQEFAALAASIRGLATPFLLPITSDAGKRFRKAYFGGPTGHALMRKGDPEILLRAVEESKNTLRMQFEMLDDVSVFANHDQTDDLVLSAKTLLDKRMIYHSEIEALLGMRRKRRKQKGTHNKTLIDPISLTGYFLNAKQKEKDDDNLSNRKITSSATALDLTYRILFHKSNKQIRGFPLGFRGAMLQFLK